jgi:DNA-binding ferritin-like protein
MLEQLTQIDEIAEKLRALGDDAQAATEGSARNILIIGNLSVTIVEIGAKLNGVSEGVVAV